MLGAQLVRNIITSYTRQCRRNGNGVGCNSPVGAPSWLNQLRALGVAGFVGRLYRLGRSRASERQPQSASPECRATGNKKRLEEVLGTAFSLYLVIFLLVLLATSVLQFYVGRLFNIPAIEFLLRAPA
jgi:hypothetical protein